MPVNPGAATVEQDRSARARSRRPVDGRPTAGGSGTRTTLVPLPQTRSTRWPCSSPRSPMSAPVASKILRPSSPSIATYAGDQRRALAAHRTADLVRAVRSSLPCWRAHRCRRLHRKRGVCSGQVPGLRGDGCVGAGSELSHFPTLVFCPQTFSLAARHDRARRPVDRADHYRLRRHASAAAGRTPLASALPHLQVLQRQHRLGLRSDGGRPFADPAIPITG